MSIHVREMTLAETMLMIRYFLESDDDYIRSLGADPAKLPEKEIWQKQLAEDLNRPLQERKFYYLTWLVGEQPVGHSNIAKIIYGQEAYMHLHLWHPDKRQHGLGCELVRKSIPKFFNTFNLQMLYCEPFADNLPPNHTLPKAGFEFVKKYETVPGWMNFKQFVNRWQLPREKVDKP